MREQYIEMRTRRNFDASWFYAYYLDKIGNRNPLDFQTFNHVFSMYFSVNKSSIIDHLDRVFEINTLLSSEGTEILIIK